MAVLFIIFFSNTNTDSNKIESTHKKFDILRHNRFFKNHNYNYAMENSKLHTLYERRRYFDLIFINNFYNGYITCPSLLETVSIRVPSKKLRDFSTFYYFVFTQQMPFRSQRLGCQWGL
jgi:hypothetical protein